MSNDAKTTPPLPVSVRTPVFKFATVRSSTGISNRDPILEIQPATALARSIVSTLQSGDDQLTKIQAINQLLQPQLQSARFFKAKADVTRAVNNSSGASVTARQASGSADSGTGNKDQASLQQLLETLYDNLLIRTVTKSTQSEVFKSVSDQIKTVYQQLNSDKISTDQIKDLRILLPEGLVFAFSPPKISPPAVVPPDPSPLLAQMQSLSSQKASVQEMKSANFERISVEQDRLRQQVTSVIASQLGHTSSSAATTTTHPEIGNPSASAARTANDVSAPLPTTSPLLDELQSEAAQLRKTESQIDAQIGDLSRQIVELIPKTQLTQVGSAHVDLNLPHFTIPPPTGGEIVVHSDGCALKFPFQIADLRIVEQQAVAYVPGEIAHINNTQQGETLERNTRRLTRIETTESLTTEHESTQETDTQSTEKFSLERAASEILSEQSSIDVNASVSADYGMVKGELDAGYSTSQSSQNSDSSSQSYAKETMEKTVTRVSTKVTEQRTTTTLQEFEERVKHVVDSTKADGPKSYVYRWLTKCIRCTLKKYGKRLIFQVDIPYPLSYYLAKTKAQTPTLDLPPDPRTATLWNIRPIDLIKPGSYIRIGDFYKTKLDAPPADEVVVSYSIVKATGFTSAAEAVTIPDGYAAKSCTITWAVTGTDGWGDLIIMVGLTLAATWLAPASSGKPPGEPLLTISLNLNNETKELKIVSMCHGSGWGAVIEVKCAPTDAAFRDWQLKCYYKLIDAYDALKAEAEAQISGFNPNAPGLNPDEKQNVIMTELKKGALSKMFRCNPFWVTDDYKVGNEYDPDCCKDTLSAEKIRFLETLFDWRNMTYALYPYFYASKQNWAVLSSLTDEDSRFQAALQASYATVRIPVFRDSMKERAAINFIINNSIANYETVPAELTPVVDELNDLSPSKFTVGPNGEDLEIPSEIVDLGVFPVPTELVILERGVADGVKPIGFPPSDQDTTDFTIPKQYSPAIIDDSSVVAPPSGH